MKHMTRREVFMNAVAKGEEAPIEPLTREEVLLAEHAKREASGGSGGSGGVTSWNDLTDRPFGEDYYTLWDKNDCDFESLEIVEGYVKVYDDAWVRNQLENARVTMYEKGSRYETSVSLVDLGDPGWKLPGIGFALYEDYEYNGAVLTPGMWLMCEDGHFVEKFEAAELIQLDPKYITPAYDVLDATDETDIVQQFNMLLANLRYAGFLA